MKFFEQKVDTFVPTFNCCGDQYDQSVLRNTQLLAKLKTAAGEKAFRVDEIRKRRPSWFVNAGGSCLIVVPWREVLQISDLLLKVE